MKTSTRVKTIVNNSTAHRDRHVFFLTETQTLPCIYYIRKYVNWWR